MNKHFKLIFQIIILSIRNLGERIMKIVQVKNELAREFLAETLGIFYLVSFGCASCASNLFFFRKNPSINSQLSIHLSFGFGATVAIIIVGKVSGKLREKYL